MSLEKKKETKGVEKEKILKDSSFRETNFTLLQEKFEKETKKEKQLEIESIDVEEELTEIQKDVLEIAEEVLKLKRYDTEFSISSEAEVQRYPIIEKLYAKCIGKLSYNKGYTKEEIFLAIRDLEEKNWIVTNERRTKSEILNNEKYIAILNFIRNNPGIHARDEKIEKELKITRTPFLKQVLVLEKFGLIRSKKVGKNLSYFLSEIPENYDEYKVVFLNPLIPQILEQIFTDESLTYSKIGENLDVYSGTIQYYIKKLKDLDLIKSARDQSGKKIHLINLDVLKKYNEIFKEPDFTNLLRGL